ncbi:Alanine racemase [Fructilactobacillus florum 8D]|uniref:Alanine racemase n=1 Tax=Fructilactobacillus florum 8D TaxID=1221538 RepID=W9EL69_9LACO|nr:alanine racemase [Fructilactobacillus florum]EKK20105.1 Alanine racemase [Fructilactobacillus florum 2F]ETO40399.1 Alanine racemase [Fructilactobacillus florum 8D]
MVIGEHRPAEIIIDETALYHNIHTEQQRLSAGTEMFMVVKANGYGHGAVQVAKVARAAGATGFCVAILDEALELRRAGFVTEPILVLGITSISCLPLILKYNITVTVSSIEWLKQAIRQLSDKQLTNQLRFFLALDTGMGRIGLQTKETVKQFSMCWQAAQTKLDFQGVYTHFATADESDAGYFEQQQQRFATLMSALPKRPRYVSVANSATSLWHQTVEANLVRFGIAGYGLNPAGTLRKAPFQLQPALSFTSELVFVKQVQPGTSIGYGATYTTPKTEWIGTLPVGYADGVDRRLQGFHVIVAGQFCQIVGRVCMDQLMIRLPQKMPIGTPVTLVGTEANLTITLDDVANYCHTINYEVACGYSARLPRFYQA